MTVLETFARIGLFVLGAAGIVYALSSIIRTLVLPRAAGDLLVRITFVVVRRAFHVFAPLDGPYERLDRVMAMYGPVALLSCMAPWMLMILLGYSLIYTALGVTPFVEALRESGSSLFTLGFSAPPDTATAFVAFSEAALGPLMIALLISYLPTIYSAFQRREAGVTMLEIRAGTPPNALELLSRYQRIRGSKQLSELWPQWELWFTDLEESHTTLPVLNFFRSPQSDRSWILAAGTVLDTAALVASTLEREVSDPHSLLCLRAGFMALRRVSDFFEIPYRKNPQRGDPISISKDEYLEIVEKLRAANLPIRADLETAWLDFAGWRVNYDDVLLRLCSLILAPPGALWSSDRMPSFRMPPVFPRRRNRSAHRRFGPPEPGAPAGVPTGSRGLSEAIPPET